MIAIAAAEEWAGESSSSQVRQFIRHEHENHAMRSANEIGPLSPPWDHGFSADEAEGYVFLAAGEGSKSYRVIRSVALTAGSNAEDQVLRGLLLLISSGASMMSFVIAGIAVAISVWLVMSHTFMPLLASATTAFCFGCVGWAQRVIGKRIAEASRRHGQECSSF